MNLKLTFFDRISIPQILPEKANWVDAVIIQDIRDKLKITQQEITDYNIRNTPDNAGVEWDSEPQGGVDVEMTDAEVKVINKAFGELDKKAQIPTDPKFIALYKKFINE